MRAEKRYWMAAYWCKSSHRRDAVPERYPLSDRRHGESSRWSRRAVVEAPVGLGNAGIPRVDAATALLCIQARVAVRAVLRLDHGHAEDGAYRPASGQGRVCIGGATRDASAWPKERGSSCSRKARARRVGKQGKYKSGGARFACAAGAPVVPVAHNAGHVWPRKSFLKYAGIVTMSIGRPIDTTGLTPEEVNLRVERWIETEMRRIDPDSYGPADRFAAEPDVSTPSLTLSLIPSPSLRARLPACRPGCRYRHVRYVRFCC